MAELYGAENYRLAFIVVSKRINTRIFTADCQNPSPGTVVDDCVTLPER
jgi:aubergine-like protein